MLYALCLLRERNLLFAFILIFSIFIKPDFVNSQETDSQEFGRLRDGRAYRVDEGGMRLVDRLAELEVTNRELEQELRSLEDELEERRKGCPAQTVCEITPQLPVESQQLDVSAKQATDQELLTCKTALQSASSQASRCEISLDLMQSRVQSLEQETGRLEQLSSTKVDAGTLKALRDKAQRDQEQLEHTLSAVEKEAAGRTKEKQDLENALKDQELLLKEHQQKEQELNHRIDMLIRHAKELENKLADKEKELKTAKHEVTPSKKEVASIKQATESFTPRQTSQAVALSSAKVFSDRLKQIEALIADRKNAYDTLRRNNRSVTVSLQHLKTRQGLSLDMLRLEIKRFSGDLKQQEKIQQGLAEIEELLRDDISVLKRIGNL